MVCHGHARWGLVIVVGLSQQCKKVSIVCVSLSQACEKLSCGYEWSIAGVRRYFMEYGEFGSSVREGFIPLFYTNIPNILRL